MSSTTLHLEIQRLLICGRSYKILYIQENTVQKCKNKGITQICGNSNVFQFLYVLQIHLIVIFTARVSLLHQNKINILYISRSFAKTSVMLRFSYYRSDERAEHQFCSFEERLREFWVVWPGEEMSLARHNFGLSIHKRILWERRGLFPSPVVTGRKVTALQWNRLGLDWSWGKNNYIEGSDTLEQDVQRSCRCSISRSVQGHIH